MQVLYPRCCGLDIHKILPNRPYLPLNTSESYLCRFMILLLSSHKIAKAGSFLSIGFGVTEPAPRATGSQGTLKGNPP